MVITIGDIIMYSASFISLYIIVLLFLALWVDKSNIAKPKSPKNYSKVCIIVPCFNEEKTVTKTVHSLLNLDYPQDKLEIIIIDDGSTDRTYERAKKLLKYPQVKLFRKKNGGKWTALNYGLTKTKAKFVGCLDSDSFVSSQALKLIMAYFMDSKIMVVTSSIKVYHPKNILERVQRIEYLSGIFLRQSLSSLDSLTVAPGPFSIYRKKVFEMVGLFQEGHHTEDMEMTLRIQSQNYRIINAPEASVYTVSPSSFKALYRQRQRWYSGSIRNIWDYRYLFLNQKYGDLGLFALPSIVIAIVVLTIMIFYGLFIFIQTIINQFAIWRVVNFDLNQITFNLNWFFINTSALLFIGLFTLIFVIIAVLCGQKISNEKQGLIKDFLLYFFIYGILLFTWWIGVVQRMLSNKGYKW